jgi:hypothetical protein
LRGGSTSRGSSQIDAAANGGAVLLADLDPAELTNNPGVARANAAGAAK